MRRNIFIISLIILFAGCKASDHEIRADIAGKAKQDLNFSGLSYSVQNGVVNVTGRCPSDKAFADVQQTLKGIHVIKAIHYKVSILPVVLNEWTPTRLKVDSLLAKYPGVAIQTDPDGLTLKGSLSLKAKSQLISELNKQHLPIPKDSLVIK